MVIYTKFNAGSKVFHSWPAQSLTNSSAVVGLNIPVLVENMPAGSFNP